MTSYSLLIFLHVLSAVSLFGAWAVEAVVTVQLRQSAALQQGRFLWRVRTQWSRAGRASMLTALVTGLWMMFLRWMVPGAAPAAWMMGSVVALIVIITAGVMLERRAVPELSQALGEDADLSREEALRAGDALLASLWIRIPIGIAILALMTMKPGTSGTVAVLSAGFAAGIAVVLVAYRRRPVPGGAAARS